MNNKICSLFILMALMTLLYACATTNSLPRTHPEDVGTAPPNCSECHSDSWAAMNHQAPDFMNKHGRYAGSSRQACASCHQESFCSDCHAHKEEMKPSEKHSESPELTFPHRGDYLSQHKIDGRINPVSCVKCHGRQNNEGCVSCHR